MPPRFNSTRTRARNRAAVAKALALQCAQNSEDYAALVSRHRHEQAVLRQALDDALAVNAALAAALDRADEDADDLRRDLAELQTFAAIARWRRGHVLSWRGWWSVAREA